MSPVLIIPNLHLIVLYSKGLPTRSRQVSEFMTGLEKTKAAQGESTQSARALDYEIVRQLYRVTVHEKDDKERLFAIIRYVCLSVVLCL